MQKPSKKQSIIQKKKTYNKTNTSSFYILFSGLNQQNKSPLKYDSKKRALEKSF
jgi:hypothetical protein